MPKRTRADTQTHTHTLRPQRAGMHAETMSVCQLVGRDVIHDFVHESNRNGRNLINTNWCQRSRRDTTTKVHECRGCSNAHTHTHARALPMKYVVIQLERKANEHIERKKNTNHKFINKSQIERESWKVLGRNKSHNNIYVYAVWIRIFGSFSSRCLFVCIETRSREQERRLLHK